MALLKRITPNSPDKGYAPYTRGAGLVGSHRDFLRNWSNCLLVAPCSPGHPGPRRATDAGDAYSIAGRCLADWRGQPWKADVIASQRLVPPTYRRSFLLAPTRIAQPSDVKHCVEALLEEKRRLPRFWQEGRAAVLFALCTLVSEMGQNVCEHSGSFGCVTICWHDGGVEERPLVSVGIVDAGIGMRRSIAGRLRAVGQPADLSDAEAIARAFELPYPTMSTEKRGTGLRMSRDLIHRFHGVMHVRSGDAVVSVGASAELLVSRCASRHVPLPGTQICVYLTPPSA